MALAYTVRDRMLARWVSTAESYTRLGARTVAYFSAEFLFGPHLGNNLVNLGIAETARQAMRELSLNYEELLGQEEEPGLGNGGLGRLAACFLDSLATQEIPALGYRNHTANTLRLWRAEAPESFDLSTLNRGDYWGAVNKKVMSENLTKVLYPNDEQIPGHPGRQQHRNPRGSRGRELLPVRPYRRRGSGAQGRRPPAHGLLSRQSGTQGGAGPDPEGRLLPG